MKVTLNKNLQLRTAQVYLRFQKEEEREDIQEYLNGNKKFEPLIENRIKDYLKNIGVFDEKHQLTKYGNTVKETGKMLVSEEGKYQIWFSQNDSFFGNKIFYFRRLQPNAKDEIRDRITLDKEGHFLLPTNDKKYTKLNLVSTQIYGNTNNGNDQLHFSWVWENLQKSHYYFDGQLGKQDRQTKIKGDAIPSDKDIQKIIAEILPEWNNEQKRYSVRFDGLSEESRKTFEDKNYTSPTKWKGLSVQIQNLPLMPYDKEEAKKWRNWLLNEELKKSYYSPTDFEDTVFELNEKKVFKPFSLDVPKAKDFVQKADSKQVFWHLNAPMDLNPNTKVKLLAKPVELKQGDKVSFADIVSRLGFDNNSVCVYYDRYVINEKQQKAVSALAKAVNATKSIVITDISPKDNGSDFIQRNRPEIKLRDYKTIFKAKSPHDRYLIVANKNEITIWNISNSVDYISFSDRNIDKNTVGTIRQSVVFTPISKEMLDKDLLNFINNESKNGN